MSKCGKDPRARNVFLAAISFYHIQLSIHIEVYETCCISASWYTIRESSLEYARIGYRKHTGAL